VQGTLTKKPIPVISLTATVAAEAVDSAKRSMLHGQAPMSASLALRSECAGVSTARAWLAMQVAHDLAVVRATGTPRVRRLDERG
jgi:plasmid maintenance system antidote protein VapI